MVRTLLAESGWEVSSPTQRSLKWFRDLGIPVAIVEKWNPHSKTRIDLFGCFDLLALCDGHMLGVQVGVTGDQSKKIRKIIAAPHFPAWLAAGGRAIVHGWSKKGKAGKRKLWVLDATPVTLEMLPVDAEPETA